MSASTSHASTPVGKPLQHFDEIIATAEYKYVDRAITLILPILVSIFVYIHYYQSDNDGLACDD
jgi:hypothetical protein